MLSGMTERSNADLGTCVQLVIQGWDLWDEFTAKLEAVRSDPLMREALRLQRIRDLFWHYQSELVLLAAEYVKAGGSLQLRPAREVFSLPRPREIPESAMRAKSTWLAWE